MAGHHLVLHYHLFKNAGTSVDAVLKDAYGPGWRTTEFKDQGGNNTAAVVEWLAANPETQVLSSHTMMGPVPEVPGVTVRPIMMFREPMARIRSAYLFESRQTDDTPGARLAQSTDMTGYVRHRLDSRYDRQCRDFQTYRLSTLCPGPEPELVRAREALDRLCLAGMVERFDQSMGLLARRLRPFCPGFSVRPQWLNRTGGTHPELRDEIGEALFAELVEANRQDEVLVAEVAERLDAQIRDLEGIT